MAQMTLMDMKYSNRKKKTKLQIVENLSFSCYNQPDCIGKGTVLMKYKILIIDDEEMILSMMKKCLQEKFSVYTADSARKALELLTMAFDIILLDINMPEMDGLELCRLIRKHISCPVIFLTARVAEEDVIKGLSVGADDYITKPFSMNCRQEFQRICDGKKEKA